jgi:hypothetical protein
MAEAIYQRTSRPAWPNEWPNAIPTPGPPTTTTRDGDDRRGDQDERPRADALAERNRGETRFRDRGDPPGDPPRRASGVEGLRSHPDRPRGSARLAGGHQGRGGAAGRTFSSPAATSSRTSPATGAGGTHPRSTRWSRTQTLTATACSVPTTTSGSLPPTPSIDKVPPTELAAGEVPLAEDPRPWFGLHNIVQELLTVGCYVCEQPYSDEAEVRGSPGDPAGADLRLPPPRVPTRAELISVGRNERCLWAPASSTSSVMAADQRSARRSR